jgi:hypothetical protein
LADWHGNLQFTSDLAIRLCGLFVSVHA